MHKEPGDVGLDIRDTLHRISMCKIIIAGQTDFIGLLEQIFTCLKRNKERTSKSDTGADLKWLAKYNSKHHSFESRTDSDKTNIGFKISRKIIAEKRQHKKFNRQHDAAEIEICARPGDSVKISETLGYGFSNCYYTGKMGKLENITIYEELVRDLGVIASSHNETLDNEMLDEIGKFEVEITKQLDEARKSLRDQLMISVGYRFLIMNVKLKIANAVEEIEKEKRLEKILSKCLDNSSHLQSEKEVASSERIKKTLVNIGDDNYDRFSVGGARDDNKLGDDVIDEEGEKRQEIERLKESILLADCVINMQKSEIEASKILIQDMCSKIKKKKAELEAVDRGERNGMLSSSNEISGIGKGVCTGIEKQLITNVPIAKSSPKQAFEDNNLNKILDNDVEHSVQYSGDEHSIEKSYTDEINRQNIELIGKSMSSCRESDTAILLKDGLDSATNGLIQTEIIKNKYSNGYENESGLIHKPPPYSYSFPSAAPECFNVTSDFIVQNYESFEDNLCEIWLEKLSVVSNLMKIPNEVREEEEAENVTYYVNDAPRALGRSKRGKCRNWFRQTVYRTKAIAV